MILLRTIAIVGTLVVGLSLMSGCDGHTDHSHSNIDRHGPTQVHLDRADRDDAAEHG